MQKWDANVCFVPWPVDNHFTHLSQLQQSVPSFVYAHMHSIWSIDYTSHTHTVHKWDIKPETRMWRFMSETWVSCLFHGFLHLLQSPRANYRRYSFAWCADIADLAAWSHCVIIIGIRWGLVTFICVILISHYWCRRYAYYITECRQYDLALRQFWLFWGVHHR